MKLEDLFAEAERLEISQSSIRAYSGDRVFLKFGEDKTFDVSLAPSSESDATGIAAIYDALGIALDELEADASIEEQLAPVNEALGLRSNAPRRRTVAMFNHRRQEELASLVQAL